MSAFLPYTVNRLQKRYVFGWVFLYAVCTTNYDSNDTDDSPEIFTQLLEIATVIICHLFKVFSDETFRWKFFCSDAHIWTLIYKISSYLNLNMQKVSTIFKDQLWLVFQGKLICVWHIITEQSMWLLARKFQPQIFGFIATIRDFTEGVYLSILVH